MATAGNAILATTNDTTRPRPEIAPPTDLEVTLRLTVEKMRRSRHGRRGYHVDLQALAEYVMEAAIRDEYAFSLCGAENPASPTADEHRLAQGLAGAVASRFQRATRRIMRTLRSENPANAAEADQGRDANGCPAWCHKNHPGDEWHESKPISFTGPGDMYDDEPEPFEVMWASLSEVPTDELKDGTEPGPYIYFDTLSIGQGSRLDLDQTDALIRNLVRYLAGLQALRDRLAALTDHA